MLKFTKSCIVLVGRVFFILGSLVFSSFANALFTIAASSRDDDSGSDEVASDDSHNDGYAREGSNNGKYYGYFGNDIN